MKKTLGILQKSTRNNRWITKVSEYKINIQKLIIFKYDEQLESIILKQYHWDFPGGAVVKNLPANAGDTGSIPGPGRSHMP